MRMKFGKFNKKEIIDAAIGALVVENAPTLLSMVAPSTFSGGVTGTVLSGAVAYLAGMLLKKPTVGNVGIAVAIAKLANEQMVAPLLNSVAGTPATVRANSRRLGLREYTSTPRSSKNYAFAYN